MKLNYSKKEIVNLMEKKALFATPLSFNLNGFKRRVYLTNLHDGAIRISFMYGIPDVNVLDSCSYDDIKKTIKKCIKQYNGGY